MTGIFKHTSATACKLDGKVTDKGDGKIKVETKTKMKVEDGDDKETKTSQR